jgi:hypothetical protein
MAATTSAGTPGVEDSQGSTFVFNGHAFKATKIDIKYGSSSSSGGSNSQIDVSHLALATGSNKQYQSPPLNEVSSSTGTAGVLATIDIDFLGLEKPDMAEHPIDCGAKLKVSGKARCASYNVTASVNDVLKGSASFELTVADATYTPITPTTGP